MTEYYVPIEDYYTAFDAEFNHVRLWLNETIGRQAWQFHGMGSHHPLTIRFENKEDALAFKLKFNL